MKNKNKNTTRCGNGATKSTHLSDGQSVTPSFGHSLSHPFTHSLHHYCYYCGPRKSICHSRQV